MLHNFVYGINKFKNDRTLWRCTSYTKTKCSATVTTCKDTAILFDRHNHFPPKEQKNIYHMEYNTNIKLLAANVDNKVIF